MRQIFILGLVVLPLLTLGQIKKSIKVINGITGENVTEVYCYIIKNADCWIDFGKTDKAGIFSAQVTDFDSTALYQIDISSEVAFKKFRQNISLLDEKSIVVEIFPNTDYIERKPYLIYSDCSEFDISFGSYVPKTPTSLNDLPENIRIKLVAHLIDKLGKAYYSKLKMSGGQIVDIDRLYKVEKNAKDYKWIPYCYYICFSLQEIEKGIGLHTTQIVLDKFGNIIKDIQLPSISENPEKAVILSLGEASDLAKKYNFTSELKNISLWFDRESDNLTWCFKKTVNDNGLTFGTETLIINAHTGEKLKISYGGGIR